MVKELSGNKNPTGEHEELVDKYATIEEVVRFKRNFLDSFRTTGKIKSPKFVSEFLMCFGDDEKIKRRTSKRGAPNGSDMFIWLGEYTLDLSGAEYNTSLRDYASEIRKRPDYFRIKVPTMIRCDIVYGERTFEVSDLMPTIRGNNNGNISFQTKHKVSSKDEFFRCLQEHVSFCLVHDILPDEVIQKIALSVEDRWFKGA